MSKNYLNKILTSKEKLKGELGAEQEAYKEFISGRWREEIADSGQRSADGRDSGKRTAVSGQSSMADVSREAGKKLYTGGIVYFHPVYADAVHDAPVKSLTKLAADGNGVSKTRSETYFYVSDDDNFALKVDEKTTPEESSLVAAIISEDSRDLSDTILYCPETNKYFLHNSKNEIILSGFKNFEYKKFTFRMLEPKAKIFLVMPKESTEYTALTLNLEFSVKKHTVTENGLTVELENAESVKSVVLKSSRFTDFVSVTKNEIFIPKAIAGPKFELLIY